MPCQDMLCVIGLRLLSVAIMATKRLYHQRPSSAALAQPLTHRASHYQLLRRLLDIKDRRHVFYTYIHGSLFVFDLDSLLIDLIAPRFQLLLVLLLPLPEPPAA